MNPFVFIVGGARSGTTLLTRVLNTHPELALTQETHWIPTLFQQRVGLTPRGTGHAGARLSELGYPRAVPQPGSEAAALAADIRQAFIHDVYGYELVLPHRW